MGLKGSAQPVTARINKDAGEVGDQAGPDDWRLRAACLGMSNLMFDMDRIEDALDVCRSCDVVPECREAVMSDGYLRRAYVAVGAVVGGLPPSKLKARRSDAKPLPEVRLRRCVQCKELFKPKTGGSKLCSPRCKNKRHLIQKKRWEKNRYGTLPTISDPR